MPELTGTAHPPNSLLAQEASAVTYDWDTDTLFVVGDGGTSIVQLSKTDGHLINSMTLAPGPSPQGTDFYDTEGLTYVGGGQFVIVEERDRQAGDPTADTSPQPVDFYSPDTFNFTVLDVSPSGKTLTVKSVSMNSTGQNVGH